MIYEVTYKDRAGNTLQVVTFAADDPREAMLLAATTPTFEPPPGTYDIDLRCTNGTTGDIAYSEE